MKSMRHRAFVAAIFAGMGNIGTAESVSASASRHGDDFLPKYTSSRGNYWNPVPNAKRRGKTSERRNKKKKGTHPSKKKHRVKGRRK